MVNKQYNVQSIQQKANGYSPPPNHKTTTSSSSVISQVPNPLGTNLDQPSSILSFSSASDDISSPVNSVYIKNITMFGDDDQNKETNAMTNGSEKNKDLTIEDIGRFQYILQMDRETANQHGNVSTLPMNDGQPSTSSLSALHSYSSISSVDATTIDENPSRLHFWKATSIQSPIKRLSCNKRFKTYSKNLWKYGKWPLAVLFVCGIGGLLMYSLILSGKNKNESQPIQDTKTQLILDPQYFEKFKDDKSTVYFGANKFNSGEEKGNDLNDGIEEIIETKNANGDTELLTIFIKKPLHSDTDENGASTVSAPNAPPSRNTQILEISTSKMNRLEPDDIVNTNETESQLIFPTKGTLKLFGFTSGHQNNFGVPIEEDERILRLINEQIMQEELKKNGTHYTSTTDASIYRTRVSPTLPVIQRHSSTTESYKNYTEESVCQSTSLSLCQGVLHYDLTISRNLDKLSSIEMEHFKYIIDSECSLRTDEFICTALEPECRPKRMGVLQPCKRICKAVLEQCAPIVAASEILTALFDCDSYPDSDDANVCDDPTRRGKCYENEFQCSDSSCIPMQWKCDNIKDCANGEDEENCVFCEQEEFKCYGIEKCIPEKWRCDQYEDCPDASDETDCYDEEGTTLEPVYVNGREYPFVQEQNPQHPDQKPYFKLSNEDREKIQNNRRTQSTVTGTDNETLLPTAAENVEFNETEINRNQDQIKDEIQTGAASGRTILHSKSLSNFQDSKEIMMTSDSESDYKFQSSKGNDKNSPIDVTANQCPNGELRCINGRCITLNQLCDKIMDCPDAADESMCVYRN